MPGHRANDAGRGKRARSARGSASRLCLPSNWAADDHPHRVGLTPDATPTGFSMVVGSAQSVTSRTQGRLERTVKRRVRRAGVEETFEVEDRIQLSDDLNQRLDENLGPGEEVRVIVTALGLAKSRTAIVATDHRVFVFRRLPWLFGTTLASGFGTSRSSPASDANRLREGFVALVGPGLPWPADPGRHGERNQSGNVLPVQASMGRTPDWLQDRLTLLQTLISMAGRPQVSAMVSPDPIEQVRRVGRTERPGRNHSI